MKLIAHLLIAATAVVSPLFAFAADAAAPASAASAPAAHAPAPVVKATKPDLAKGEAGFRAQRTVLFSAAQGGDSGRLFVLALGDAGASDAEMAAAEILAFGKLGEALGERGLGFGRLFTEQIGEGEVEVELFQLGGWGTWIGAQAGQKFVEFAGSSGVVLSRKGRVCLFGEPHQGAFGDRSGGCGWSGGWRWGLG